MDTIYIALVRWGPEWDGQSIYYTHSKALFEQIETVNYNEVFFDDFSDELKAHLRITREAFNTHHPDVVLDAEEDMSISEALEWLQVVSPKFPVIIGGETELTCSWNW
jgi:hypothetical protein